MMTSDEGELVKKKSLDRTERNLSQKVDLEDERKEVQSWGSAGLYPVQGCAGPFRANLQR